MSRRYDKDDAKKRILSVCVKLFIEKGYNQTTNAEILKLTGLSNGTFYNIFHSKDGILQELANFMFSNQFGIANKSPITNDPIMIYSLETSIQLTLTELNENLREIYLEAYSNPTVCDIVHHRTAKELFRIFRNFLPEYTEADFYELDIGTSGVMRGYMAKKCDCYFTLERKLRRFLEITLSTYRVPFEKQEAIISQILSMDITSIANSVMQRLFSALEMQYDFVLALPEPDEDNLKII